MYTTYAGQNALIELARGGVVTSYRMTGQGIAEQVGTSTQDHQTLLDVLLTPAGLSVGPNNTIASPSAA